MTGMDLLAEVDGYAKDAIASGCLLQAHTTRATATGCGLVMALIVRLGRIASALEERNDKEAG